MFATTCQVRAVLVTRLRTTWASSASCESAHFPTRSSCRTMLPAKPSTSRRSERMMPWAKVGTTPASVAGSSDVAI